LARRGSPDTRSLERRSRCDAPHGPGADDAGGVRAALERYRRHWEEHGFGVWAAELLATGELVGRIGLSYHRAWPDDPELGWLIDPAHTGLGLATEGGAAGVQYGFGTLGAGRLVSICTEENVESRRVMAKLDFTLHQEVPFEELGITLWVHARDSK